MPSFKLCFQIFISESSSQFTLPSLEVLRIKLLIHMGHIIIFNTSFSNNIQIKTGKDLHLTYKLHQAEATAFTERRIIFNIIVLINIDNN